MKIDVFAHVLPARYLEERNRRAGAAFSSQYRKYSSAVPALHDLGVRFRVMDQFDDVVQLLTIAGPNVESITKPADTVELARIANDEMADLVAKYPDRFVGAVACLPMNDIEAALREAERTIEKLGFHGVEIFTDVNGRPVDSPEFLPLYELMVSYDLPVVLHPRRTDQTPDYPGEEKSKYLVYTNFGWPYATSVAMARLAFGVLVNLPTLKVLTHHGGGMVPYFHKRAQFSWDLHRAHMDYQSDGRKLEREPLDYYRMFYCDTVLQGNSPALMCALAFFGEDHMLFATDAPYDDRMGERLYRETIASVEAMEIGADARKKIYEDNARKLFRLTS
ncbi:MAG TPA: amidohydrolase family protein [Vicinamibacteria bacterium]|nr:amidohydrolase family protein [Vicinamibacteria bacterium]